MVNHEKYCCEIHACRLMFLGYRQNREYRSSNRQGTNKLLTLSYYWPSLIASTRVSLVPSLRWVPKGIVP